MDAKSILSVLMLAVHKDHFVELRAEGVDATQAIEALKALIESDFGGA
jgi:phosphotransferase system HPr (HPr) family protein